MSSEHAPLPQRSVEELASLAIERGLALRRRYRIRQSLVIGLTVALVGATIPIILRNVDEARRLTPTEEREKRVEQDTGDVEGRGSRPSGGAGGRSSAGLPGGGPVDGLLPTPTPRDALPGQGTIVFASARGGANADIYLMRSDGGDVRRLTTDAIQDARPDASPAGDRIVFERDSDLYVMKAVPGAPEPLTQTPDEVESSPDWSPDALRIVFARGPSSTTDSEIYAIEVASGAVTRLSNTSGVAEDHPAWSPNGERIAFFAEGLGEGSGLFVMNADGTNRHRLTTGLDVEPTWSPDGSRIAFTRFDRFGYGDVFVVEVETSTEHKLTGSGATSELSPSWSPDGTKIAFVKDPDAAATAFPRAVTCTAARVCPGSRETPEPLSSIHVMAADGSDVRLLTGADGTTRDAQPDWAPWV